LVAAVLAVLMPLLLALTVVTQYLDRLRLQLVVAPVVAVLRRAERQVAAVQVVVQLGLVLAADLVL
jgi:hypothetical protein